MASRLEMSRPGGFCPRCPRAKARWPGRHSYDLTAIWACRSTATPLPRVSRPQPPGFAITTRFTRAPLLSFAVASRCAMLSLLSKLSSAPIGQLVAPAAVALSQGGALASQRRWKGSHADNTNTFIKEASSWPVHGPNRSPPQHRMCAARCRPASGGRQGVCVLITPLRLPPAGSAAPGVPRTPAEAAADA